MTVDNKERKEIEEALGLPSLDKHDLLDKAITGIIMSLGGLSHVELQNYLSKGSKASWLNSELDAVVKDLIRAEYIHVVKRSYNVGIIHDVDYYVISLKGVQYCRKPVWPYRGRPFHYQIVAERINILWKVVRTFAAICFAIATIGLGFLTYKNEREKKDKEINATPVVVEISSPIFKK